MSNQPQTDIVLHQSTTQLEVLNVDKTLQIKSIVLTNNFKVKQLNRPRTQIAEVGDYVLRFFHENKESVFLKTEEDMILTQVGDELRVAMLGAIKDEVFDWLEESDFTHKELKPSLRTTKLCKVHEQYIDEINRLFRGNAVPRHLMNCILHHRYTGLPTNLYTDVKSFEPSRKTVVPVRETYEGGLFMDVSWLVFYAEGKARYVNSKTNATDRLSLENAVIAFKFTNDRRESELFLNVQCWVVSTL